MSNLILTITNIGSAKIATAISSGIPVLLTQIAVGSGDGTLLVPASTALQAEVWRGSIVAQVFTGLTINLTASIPPGIGGFNIGEIGLFDSTGAMIAYAYIVPKIYKPQLSDGWTIALTITISLTVSNLSAITIIDGTASNTDQDGVVTLVNGQQSYAVVFGTPLISAPTKISITVYLNGSGGEILTGHPDQTTFSTTGFTFLTNAPPSVSGAKAFWRAKV